MNKFEKQFNDMLTGKDVKIDKNTCNYEKCMSCSASGGCKFAKKLQEEYLKEISKQKISEAEKERIVISSAIINHDISGDDLIRLIREGKTPKPINIQLRDEDI
ncbi:MAG: hypothetical protein RR342_03720 [Bacilli bacterium]